MLQSSQLLPDKPLIRTPTRTSSSSLTRSGWRTGAPSNRRRQWLQPSPHKLHHLPHLLPPLTGQSPKWQPSNVGGGRGRGFRGSRGGRGGGRGGNQSNQNSSSSSSSSSTNTNQNNSSGESLIKEVKNILTYLPKQTGPVLSIGARAANLRIVQIL